MDFNDCEKREENTSIEQSREDEVINDREPFNDAIRHFDIINGYRLNKTISDYPRKIRPWIRIIAVSTLLLFVIVVIIFIVFEI